MRLIRHNARPDGVILETSSGIMSLEPYSDRIMHIRYTLNPQFSSTASLMVLPNVKIPVDLQVTETDDALTVSIPQLSIRIDRQTCAFTYLDAAGQLLTKEPARGGKTLAPVQVYRSIFDRSAPVEARQDVDGVPVDVASYTRTFDRQAFHTKLEFEWADGEALYGLGSHEEYMMNLRGQHQYLYQQNMKAVIPVLVSTRGYGILMDSYSLMTFHDDAFGSYLWSDVDDELDYYFIYGPEFDQIVQGVRVLTGKAPLIPRWMFGYLQSKERYVSQDELIAIVSEYRQRGLPLDCIVQDWKSWPEGLWGQKSFDPERFPDPEGLTSELHRLHAHMMISIWPILNPGGDNWKEMCEHGFLLGNHKIYDAFQEQARALYWKQANEGLFTHGIDAWWCDCTEPFQADWRDSARPEPEERLQINTGEAKIYLDPEYLNAYSLLHSKGMYEGQRSTTADKRVVNLTRSSYAGQHRYGTITWSGDIVANWETLHQQIPAGLNFCVTGSPYWTLDIGGFFVKKRPDLWFWNGDFEQGVEDQGYCELYVRWFQYAAFLPILRAHGTDTPREIWRFGNPGEPMYEALVKCLRLRYRLIPYIYSLAGWTTHHDYTMLRALPFDFRADPATYNIADQFMFGPAILVNPVTQPMYYTAGSRVVEGVSKTRPVYLPLGTDWYDFWTGQRYTEGQTVTADATLDIIPLYVRSGSIVPVGPEIMYADEQPNSTLDLYIYPGQNGSFTLYEDEGDNYNYEQGHFATIRLSWDESAQRLTLHDREGGYPGIPGIREFRVCVVNGPYNPLAASSPLARTVLYEGRETTIDL